MSRGAVWGMEKGGVFDFPVSPRGIAGLLELNNHPSHRYTGDQIVIEFEADPEIVREYAPEPLELDGSGTVFLWTGDQYMFTDRHTNEFVSPKRSRFAESFFWIPCSFGGRRFYFMPFCWVNADWLAFLGRGAGVPHKIAEVEVTRFHPSEPVFNGPREGVRVCATVQNYGLIHRSYIDLKREIPASEMPFQIGGEHAPRFLGHRYVYDVARNRPAINDLCAHWGDAMEAGVFWTGEADAEFFEAENEEVLPFKPVRVVAGYWFQLLWGHGTSQPEVIVDYMSD